MFTILSLNCCLWPVGIRGTFSSAQKNERCNIIPHVLQTADVAICQEVLSWSPNKWITRMKPYLHYDWIDSDINSGLWTITHFTILSQVFIPCKYLCLYSMTHPLGFLHTTISINTHTIHVINVHMLTDEATCLFECFEKLYKQQLEHLLSYIESLHGNWIIGGDFNVDGDDLLIQWFIVHLTKVGKLSYYHPTVSTCNENVSYANHRSKHMKVDHFYTNMEMKDCRVLYENVSDHYPIIATIILPS